MRMKMMKRYILLLALLGSTLSLFAQGRLAERCYLMTDRAWYAAGEPVFLSAFCADVSSGVKLSDFSSVAYVELSSAEGVALTGKIALHGGRGAGRLDLPRTLPTGNYRLVAYTASAGNEERYDYLAGARVISVYNTLSTARVKDGVGISEPPATPSDEAQGPLQADFLPDGRILLRASERVSFGVSVYRKEPFPVYDGATLSDALAVAPSAVTDRVIPEYDGEIITLRLQSTGGEPLPEGGSVFIGRPGRPDDIYSSTLQPDGTVRFFTHNVYGKGDFVVTMDRNAPPFRVETVTPFKGIVAEGLPTLALDASLSGAVERLGARMQVAAAFEADTLYEQLPLREVPFVGENVVRYVLDDYTRFATMQEVITEYLHDLRVRRQDGHVTLQVRCRDRFNAPPYFASTPSLLLLDGVPVTDHDLLYALDPALVRYIDIYPYQYAPSRVYAGVANIITFKGDMSAVRLGGNVRIVDFTGVSYPQAYLPSGDERYPEVRETLLWQPLLELEADEQILLPAVSAEEGYVVLIEGLSASGEPVFYRKSS